MNAPAFTPGPWTIGACPCGHASCKRLQPGPGTFYTGTGYEPADAHLIAAAPELYAVVDILDRSGFALSQPVRWAIRDALAKARGEQVQS